MDISGNPVLEIAEDEYGWVSFGSMITFTATKGPDMSKFTKWLMEMYPKTEDYVYIRGTFETQNYRDLYLRIKPDPQAFLEQMKEFDEMMKEV